MIDRLWIDACLLTKIPVAFWAEIDATYFIKENTIACVKGVVI